MAQSLSRRRFLGSVAAAAVLAPAVPSIADSICAEDILSGTVHPNKIINGDMSPVGRLAVPLLNPVLIASVLPSKASAGDLAFWTKDGHLYRWLESAWEKVGPVQEGLT